MRFCTILFILMNGILSGQTIKLYTFTNDSLLLTDNKKLVLVHYTDRACFDCFVHLNGYLKADTCIDYYFAVEKSESAMANYDVYTKLMRSGVTKEKILFTKTQSHEISPFLKIYNRGNLVVIPYSEVFEDKTTLELSQKLRKETKGG